MRSSLLVAASVLLSACSAGNCPDCCPAGPTVRDVTVSCRLVAPDAGPVTGAAVRCANSDAGGVSDSSGDFSLTYAENTCGIAAGNNDCGAVRLSGVAADGGTRTIALLRADGGIAQEGPTLYSSLLDTPGCRLLVR